MSPDIDLAFRPDTFFRPQKLEKHLLSKVKGAVVRKRLQALFAEGRHAEVHELLTPEGLSANDRKALEAYHPMFMGGNYLPDTEDGEVENARISIKSTTFDVTCVYARPDEGVIHYRVVDEYGGDTLQGPSDAQTDKPMALGKFADFFLRAWPLIDVLEMNFEGDEEGAMDFFSADSDFYPEFDRLCRQRMHAHFAADESGSGVEVDGTTSDPTDALSTCGINADGVKIETANTMNAELEGKRPNQPVDWQLVASGVWSEDRYHSGHIAYFIANTGPGEWVMESVERNAELDDVTEEDVEEGRLNDDQIQAMLGMTLAEAQASEHRQIVATCSSARADWDSKSAAAALYQAVCKSGGKAIDEPDGTGGLLDL